MSKFTVIGDPHATPSNLDKIGQLFKLAEDLGNTTIWLGDFLDTKEIIRGKCLNFIFKHLKKSKLNHIILIGNHDWFNLECIDHSLQPLKELPNVTVVDDLCGLNKYSNKVIPLSGKTKDMFSECDIYFLPYCKKRESVERVLDMIPEKSVLFAHLDIKGFDYGNGHLCTDGISVKLLSKFSKVISGHFHKFQEDDKLTYLGTPFSHTFGESNQIKYIGVYEFDLKNDVNKHELRETDFPMHLTYNYNVDEMVPERELPVDGKHYIRVILNGSQENIDLFSKSVFPEGTKFIERPTDSFNNEIKIDETINNNSKFEEWATNIKKLDPETTKLGLDILRSVS